MHRLDDPRRIQELDPSNIFDIVEETDEQVRQALRIGEEVALPFEGGRFNCVLACGLGGSAIGADFLKACFAEQFRVPFLIHRNYGLPGFVDSSTLVLAGSYSGNTEETLSALEQACRQGARIVCLSSGGEMERLAQTQNLPLVRFPPGYPPRTAMGYSVFSTLQVLVRLGLISVDSADRQGCVRVTARCVEAYRRSRKLEENPAKRLACSLKGRVSVVYGSQDGCDVIARRWANQFSENAKQLAYFNSVPEMTHNEVVGWKHPGQHLKFFNVVFLCDQQDHPRVQKRMDWVGSRIGRLAGYATEIRSAEQSRLQRLWAMVILGDFVSLYLAILNGEDPAPVLPIEDLKTELRGGARRADKS